MTRRILATLVALAALNGLARAEEPQTSTADFALVPGDTPLFLSLHVGKHWNGLESQSLKQVSTSHPIVPSWWLNDLKKTVGLSPAEVERVLVIHASSGRQIVAITTGKPYNRDKVLAAIVPNAVEKKAGGKTYLFSEKSGNSLLSLNEHAFAVGFGHDLRTFFEQRSQKKIDASLARALAAAKDSLFVLNLGPTQIGRFTNKIGPESPLTPLTKAHAWQVIIKASDGLTINLLAEFSTPEQANDGAAALKKLGGQIQGYLVMAGRQMPLFLKRQEADYPGAKQLGPQMTAAVEAASDALDKWNVQTEDNRVRVTIALKTETPATTFATLLTLLPRAKKEQPAKSDEKRGADQN